MNSYQESTASYKPEPQHSGTSTIGKPLTSLESHDLKASFLAQKLAFEREVYPDLQSRKERLEKLYHLIHHNADALAKALNQDFGCRSREETEIAEIIGSLSSIRYQIRHLKKFMKPQKRRISLWFLPARGEVSLRPLGVVGVIAPWNYSLKLTITPIATALAAGNRVMAKMSELTPHTSSLLKRLVNETFPGDTLAIFDGGVEVAKQFSGLPFNHLLFTGSTSVGRLIAKSAAENLTPVTLELSGKSPVIVGKHYDVKEAANRIVWGNCFNAGQTCVAPDYVTVPKSKLEQFIEAARQAANAYYPKGLNDESYTAIINHQHAQRIQALVDDAWRKGARVETLIEAGPELVADQNKIPPTLIVDPGSNTDIFTEEVFGPVLPVFTYQDTSEVLALIKHNPDPLALYIFSQHSAEIDFITQRIPAGNIAINETLLEYVQDDLPFGGVGNSGMGKYHGREGFETFSNRQSRFTQVGLGSFTGTKLLYPPYGKLSSAMLKLIRQRP